MGLDTGNILTERGRGSANIGAGKSSLGLNEILAMDINSLAPSKDEKEPEPAIGGFHPDVARRDHPMSDFQQKLAPGIASAVDTKPRYFEGDEYEPSTLPSEKIARLQRRLVSAGVLQSSFHLGVWDEASTGAYRKLLKHANSRGQTVKASVSQFEQANTDPGEGIPDFTPDTFLKPDYAELEQAVKKTVEQRLGRKANQGDIEELTSRLSGLYRDEYDVNTELSRREYERGVAEQTHMDMTPAERIVAEAGDGLESPSVDMGEIEGVDPTARFMQEFDKRFAKEEAMVERREQGEENRDMLQNGFAGLRRTLGGMA